VSGQKFIELIINCNCAIQNLFYCCHQVAGRSQTGMALCIIK